MNATPTSKPWYESKTLWINALTIAALFIDQATGAGVITSPEGLRWTALAVAAVNLALRFVTGQPLGK